VRLLIRSLQGKGLCFIRVHRKAFVTPDPFLPCSTSTWSLKDGLGRDRSFRCAALACRKTMSLNKGWLLPRSAVWSLSGGECGGSVCCMRVCGGRCSSLSTGLRGWRGGALLHIGSGQRLRLEFGVSGKLLSLSRLVLRFLS